MLIGEAPSPRLDLPSLLAVPGEGDGTAAAAEPTKDGAVTH